MKVRPDTAWAHDERLWAHATSSLNERLSGVVSVRSGAAADVAAAGAARSAAPGLVSVPTTQKQGVALVEVKERAPNAFVPDKVLSRLAKLRRAVGFSARGHLVSEKGRRTDQCLMVTLTYRYQDGWQANHMSQFMDHIRKWCGRNGVACRYVWVAELTKAGRIHYHVALWVPHGTRLPRPDDQGWWPHGFTRIEVARAAVPYLLKYLSKGAGDTLGEFPKGARIYGVGGLEHSLRRARRWLGLPRFVQARSDVGDQWKRADGGGWISPAGEHFPSEFRRVWLGVAYGLERVIDHGRPFDVSGPFSWVKSHG